MLIHWEVAMHTDKRWEKKSMCLWERHLCFVGWTSVVALPIIKWTAVWWVMWVSRLFRFNYELITRQDRGPGRWAGSWGGETKENNNWERTEGWKLLLKTLVEVRKHYKGGTSLLCEQPPPIYSLWRDEVKMGKNHINHTNVLFQWLVDLNAPTIFVVSTRGESN